MDLWDGTLLYLPEQLVTAYENELVKHGQLEIAKAGTTDKNIHGGITPTETLKHFALRFAVSAGRPQYVLLDPLELLESIPDALLTTFSQGHVAVLDVPCGVATSTLSLLLAIAYLRQAGVLAHVPLTVSVTGGDYSPTALSIADSMLAQVASYMSSQAITINWQMKQWDAFSAVSAAALVDEWFTHAATASEYVVIVANFSGALTEANKFEEFKPCLESIVARLYNRNATILWIEPATTKAQKLLSDWLPTFFGKRLGAFILKKILGGKSKQAGYSMRNPLSTNDFKTDVVVQRYVRH